MHHDDKLRDKLTTYTQDMYAVENQLVETLDKQIDQVAKFPTGQARIRQHLDATKQHRSRMEQRLQAYGESPSAIKGMMTGMMGSITGAMSGMRADVLAMTARDDYVSESLEVAGYRMLIAAARAYGDEDTVRAAELNLRHDEEMQRWLGQHTAEAALLSLEQDGITTPAEARAGAGAAHARRDGDVGHPARGPAVVGDGGARHRGRAAAVRSGRCAPRPTPVAGRGRACVRRGGAETEREGERGERGRKL